MWLVLMSIPMVSLAVAGAYLFGVHRIQAIWGLPVVPNALFTIWLVYCISTLQGEVERGNRVNLTVLAILAAIVAIVSVVLLAVGLALPQTVLGDVFSFQIATALADSIGVFLVRYMYKALWEGTVLRCDTLSQPRGMRLIHTARRHR